MDSRNRRVAVRCAAVGVGMLGLAYASVPLYRIFCQATGYAGTTQRAAAPSTRILDASLEVRFDATVAPGLGWTFEPVERIMRVRIGETALAHYRATNTTDRTLTGTATYNVTPDQAGIFFNKLACFCFTEQTLAPGQSVDMPVSFFVDPALAADPTASAFSTITLSYTFYPVAKPAGPVTAIQPAAPAGKGS